LRKVLRSFFFGLNVLIWPCVIFSLVTAAIEYAHGKQPFDPEVKLLMTLMTLIAVILNEF
jgi:hypothetical protein